MTCLSALLLFLTAHQKDDSQISWILSDKLTWAYTSVAYRTADDRKSHKYHVDYFAFNYTPRAPSKSSLKKTGTCTLENGKEVPVLELHGNWKE